MRKKVAKFVSCLLVAALVMQDGMTAAAVNNSNTGTETTVLEQDDAKLADESSEEPVSEEKRSEPEKIVEETQAEETAGSEVSAEEKTAEKETESGTEKETEKETESETEKRTETEASEEDKETGTEESVEEETTTEIEETADEDETEIQSSEEMKELDEGDDGLYPGDIAEYGENLLPEDVFKKGESGFDYWNTTDFIFNMTSLEPVSDGKGITIQFGSENLGADYGSSISLMKDGFKLGNGHTYRISYKITSTKARAIQSGFDGTDDRNAHKYELEANTEKEIAYNITPNGEWNKLMFYMGMINDTSMSADIGEHSITISDLAIQEVTIRLEDGEPVDENPDNMLINGTFRDGNTDGWLVNKNMADVKCAKYKVAFDITGNMADWEIWLRQNDITFNSSTKYKITFDATSTVDRYIMAGCDGGGTWLAHKELKANELTHVEYQVTGMSGNNFVIALGSNLRASSAYKDWDGKDVPAKEGINQTLDPHRVTISNVCIVEAPVELPDTPNDTPYARITDLRNHDGCKPENMVILKDTGFTQSWKKNWSFWHEAWMTQYDDTAVTCRPVKDGVEVYVEITGGGEGNKPWDVQLNQKISLLKETEYVLSFKVHSEKARSINVSIADIDKGSAWTKPIAIQKNETREVVLNLPRLTEDAIDKGFQIQMGNVSGNVEKNTLTFTDMKLEVNGYSELAERISDGYFDAGNKGSFTVTGNGKAAVSFNDSYIKAEVTSECDENDVVVSSGKFNLLGDGRLYEYEASFVAGATDDRTIKAVLEDGSGTALAEQSFNLTSDAQKYSFTYKPDAPKNNVVLKLLLGGSTETVCVDTVRCDLKGYPEAAGLNTEGHDITLLEKKEVPVISEMPADKAVKGQDIVISFDKEGNEAYKNAIQSVSIDGKTIDSAKYRIGERTNEGGNGEYTITLDKDLFQVAGDRQTFTIEVKASGNQTWYQKNRIRQTVYADNTWNDTWLEEFDGTSLDMSKWSYQLGIGDNNDGWGNNEQQCYTDSEDNIKVEKGELTITARKQKNDSGRPYTSARIWTMNDDGKTVKFAQTYGRMEAKMKLAGGDGYEGVWPAFWMLPADLHYGTWPLSGEIDILETRGREPLLADGTVHYGKPWPNNESQGGVFDYSESRYNQDSDINDYHIYAVEWEPGEIRWYVDDELYFTYSNWYSQSSDNPAKFRYPAPFDQDFYIILNLAIGGTFDNNLIPDDGKMPVDMKVDYVRVYEAKNGYKEVTSEPPVIKDEDTDINQVKSELKDTDFANINIIKADGVPFKRDSWNLVTLPSFGGGADFATITEDGSVYAKITPTKIGGQAHGIQFIQHLDLVKGYSYRLSFDAWTEEGRKINLKIGQDGTEGWNTYQTSEMSLTSSKQHYKWEFQSGVTDLHSRLEFNLATSMQPVYIGNIKYEVIDEIVIDPDTEKKPFENGNCVYNGSFDVGGIDGLSYWHLADSDGKTVRDGRGYAFTASKGDLYQYGIQLLQSDSYELTFKGKAAGTRQIEVILSDRDGKSIYHQEKVTLGAGRETRTLKFTMPKGVTDTNATLRFSIGGSGAPVTITNIWLKRTTYENIEWDEVNAHPLLNGDFESGDRYWSTYQTTLTVKADENGNHYAEIDGMANANKWDSVTSQAGLEITGKTDYELSFDIWASKDDETIRMTLEEPAPSYYAHFEQKALPVGTEKQHYVYDLRFPDTLKNMSLSIQTGGADEAYKLYLDNIVLRAKGAPKAPGIIEPDAYNRLGTDIALFYDGEADWVKNAEVYIDNVKIDKAKAVFDNGRLTLDKSVFSGPDTYSLVVRSEGYTQTKAVELRIYPANGNRIMNDGFVQGENGLKYWDQYVLEKNRDSVTADDGMAKIHYGGAAYDERGNIVPWAIQLFQDNIPVESGKKYQLSFYAHAAMSRRIQVMRNQGSEVSDIISITKVPKLYKIEFDSVSDVLKLQFLLSTVAKKDGDAITKDDVLPAHDIFIDNVTLVEMEYDDVVIDKTALKGLIDECSAILENDQDKYTKESYDALDAAVASAKRVYENPNAEAAEVSQAEDALRTAKGTLEAKVDRTSLTALIRECAEYEPDEFTEESWQPFADALEAAKRILADESAQQEDIDQAEGNLSEAKEELVFAVEPDKTSLSSLVDACDMLEQDDYTEESWKAFADALETARKVLADAKARQAVIDQAEGDLSEAKETLVPVDITRNDLRNLIASCEELEEDNYTPESWKAFASVLNKAKRNVDSASQEELKAVYIELILVRKALDPRPDKTKLKDLIDECEALRQDEYTDESWTPFAKALEEAKAVMENPNALQEAVQTAQENLEMARLGLQKRDKSDDESDREGLWAVAISDVTYTGKAVKPEVNVYDGSTLLTKGKDYTITYKNNTKVTDAAQAIIRGKGNYDGSITKTFKIVAKDFNAEDIAIPNLYVKAPRAGKSVTPVPVVMRNGKKLSKKEFTVGGIKDGDGNPVSSVTEPGRYTVTVNGVEANGYTGAREIPMTVLSSDQVLMSAVKVKDIENIEYTGEIVVPQFTVKYGKDTLTPDQDYKVVCSSREVGTATAVIEGTGEKFVGEKTVTFKITGVTLNAKDVTVNASDAVYTGSAVEPDVTVAGGAVRDRDYVVSYDKNIKAGSAVAIVKGIGKYTGTVKKTFNIAAFDLGTNDGHKLSCSTDIVIPYAKGGNKLKETDLNVVFNGMRLTEGADYTLAYTANKKAKDPASVKIKGKGNFKGTTNSISFTIAEQDLANLTDITALDVPEKNAKKYNSVTPVIKDLDGKALKKGTDFKITGYTTPDGAEISDTPNVGDTIRVTVEGINNYKGQTCVDFRIIENGRDISKAKVQVQPQSYTGKEIILSEINPGTGERQIVVTMKVDGETKTLAEGTDYEIVKNGYSKNINKGTGKMTIRGINAYGGTKVVSFKINAQDLDDMKWYENLYSRTLSWFNDIIGR